MGMSWILAIYVVGLFGAAVMMLGAVSSETTSHGQGILLLFGIPLVLFWPLAVAWFLIVGIGSLIFRLVDWVRGR